MTSSCFFVAARIHPEFSTTLQEISIPSPDASPAIEASISPAKRLSKWLNSQEGLTFEIRRAEQDWRRVTFRRDKDIYYLEDSGPAA